MKYPTKIEYQTELRPCPKCGTKIPARFIDQTVNSEWLFWFSRLKLKRPIEGSEPPRTIPMDEPYWDYDSCHHCKGNEYLSKELPNTGLPEAYFNCRFDNYEIYDQRQMARVNKLKEIVNGWLRYQEMSRIYMFFGKVGTGKGHLIAALFRNLIYKYSTTCRFIKFDDLLVQLRSLYSSKKSEYEHLNSYRKADLVCLDELGFNFQNNTEFAHKILYQIVDSRFENKKPTILVSNLSSNQIQEYLKHHHGRLFSRVFAKGNVIMSFDWQDYRLKDFSDATK